jgi:hypothetical protein
MADSFENTLKLGLDSLKESFRKDLNDALGKELGATKDALGKELGATKDALGKELGAAKDALGKELGAAKDALGKELGSLRTELSDLDQRVDSRFSRLDKEVGSVYEATLRKGIAKLFGDNFAKEYTINNLQQVAKLLSKAIGWSLGTEPSDIVATSKLLASNLLDCECGPNLLKALHASCQAADSTEGSAEFKAFCKQAAGWFPSGGKLDLAAFGRSLADIPTEHDQLKKKLGLIHSLLKTPSRAGVWMVVVLAH